MRDKLNKFFPKLYVPAGLLLVLWGILHFGMQLNISDDGVYSSWLQHKTILSSMKTIYLEGSGKVLTDTAAAIFTYLPGAIWKTIDTMLYVVMAYAAVYLFSDRERSAYWSAVPCFLLYPVNLLLSAGYCTTSTNYVWTSAAIFIALLPLRKETDGKSICLPEWFLYCAAVFYACSQEQSACILIAAYCLFILWQKCVRHNKISYYIYLLLIAAVAALIVMLTSPGHIKKSIPVDNLVSVPDFPTMDILDKLYIGFTTTMAQFLSQWNVLFIVFGVLLILCVLHQYGFRLVYLVVSSVPLMTALVFVLFRQKLAKYTFYVTDYMFSIINFHPVDYRTFDNWKYYLPLLLALLVVVCIVDTLYLVFDAKTALCAIVIFLAGLCSRMIMGFSYTMFGSGNRTFTYMYFAVITLVFMLASQLTAKSGIWRRLAIVVLCFGAGITYVLSFATVYGGIE